MNSQSNRGGALGWKNSWEQEVPVQSHDPLALPPEWKECSSRSTGETYYYNTQTGDTQWERPVIPPPNLPSGWEAVASKDTGQIYFINSVTGEYQFEVPEQSAEAEALTIDEALRGAERSSALLRVLMLKLQMVYEQMIGGDGAYGAPALCLAAAEGSVEAVAAVCVSDGNSITSQHPASGAGPLHMAAYQGHVDCVEELLSFGADPFQTDLMGLSALHYAANREDVLYALLSSSSAARLAVNTEAEPNGETALLLASFHGDDGAIDCLMEYEADVDSVDSSGTTPLHMAALHGHRRAVKSLLSHGASSMRKDSSGRTAAEIASLHGHDHICSMLESFMYGGASGSDSAGANTQGTVTQEEEDAHAWARLAPDEDENSSTQQVVHKLFKVRALYDYDAAEPGDLTFSRADIIEVHSTERPGGGWWTGTLMRTGVEGVFPSNFVERVADESSITTGSTSEVNESKDQSLDSTVGGNLSSGGVESSNTGQLSGATEAEIVQLRAALGQKTAQAEKAETELEAAKSEILSLKAAMVKNADDASVREMHEQQLRQQLEAAKADQAESDSQHAEEVQILRQTIAEAELARSGEANASADAQEQIQQRETVLAETQKKLDDTLRANSDLKADATQAAERAAELEMRAGQLQRQIEEQASELEGSRRAASDAEHKLNNMDSELGPLKAQVAELEQQLAEAEALAQANTAKSHRLEQQYKKEWALRKKYYNELQDINGNVRVYCRTRPLLKFEKERGDKAIVSCPTDDSVVVKTSTTDLSGKVHGSEKTFNFHTVFSEKGSQERVFEEAKDLVQSTIDGYNVCIFAYGQTGSGKTWTMYGGNEAATKGVAPRTVDELWDLIARDRAERGLEFTVKVYLAELYMDGLRDLLDKRHYSGDDKPPPLLVKKDSKGMVQIQNITELEVVDASQTMKIMYSGMQRRHVSGTAMNAESSRSHLVFSIIVQTRNPQTGVVSRGKISLVDMAGSERVKRSEVTGDAFKEAIAINKSLAALLDVIDALSKPDSGGKRMVPYRNHLLTQLMSDSLGGNAKTLMFVNISPASSNDEETLGSLGYATRASLIKNQIKQSTDSQEVARLKKLVERLSAEVEKGHAGARPMTGMVRGRNGTPPPTRAGLATRGRLGTPPGTAMGGVPPGTARARGPPGTAVGRRGLSFAAGPQTLTIEH
eukprot:SAG31_NODE_9_length_42330_cov_441.979162_11_plen_1177_part_00